MSWKSSFYKSKEQTNFYKWIVTHHKVLNFCPTKWGHCSKLSATRRLPRFLAEFQENRAEGNVQIMLQNKINLILVILLLRKWPLNWRALWNRRVPVLVLEKKCYWLPHCLLESSNEWSFLSGHREKEYNL